MEFEAFNSSLTSSTVFSPHDVPDTPQFSPYQPLDPPSFKRIPTKAIEKNQFRTAPFHIPRSRSYRKSEKKSDIRWPSGSKTSKESCSRSSNEVLGHPSGQCDVIRLS
ncbi:hypothetical protein TNCV_2305961 [Trichonephila clavipes]|nr:hypothetical protein TNCV_2305961 [Trichonephila clavipes]